jgi:hypothetical protein
MRSIAFADFLICVGILFVVIVGNSIRLASEVELGEALG